MQVWRLREGIYENRFLRAAWSKIVSLRFAFISRMKCIRVNTVGEKCNIYPTARIIGGRNVKIGNRVTINDFVLIGGTGGVEIGDETMIAAHSTIVSMTHDIDALQKGLLYRETLVSCGPVKIGQNVWIGTSVVILPGVVIGDDSVIGAGAVVTRNIPSRTVAVGVPARVIRHLDGPCQSEPKPPK